MQKKIGRFDVIRELGKGGQGMVYLAKDTHLGRDVAIKTLKPRSNHFSAKQQLLEEARLVSKLQHANIVQLFDVLEMDDQIYLVFEYVSGETLDKTIKLLGSINRVRALNIAIQVLEGLNCAHQAGILHRDIKPANIILDHHGNARIMDFGIAIELSGKSNFAQAGTPQYMAPEFLNGKNAEINADVFSFGMVLYEMLAGRPPCTGDNLYELMHKIANLPFDPPSHWHHDIDEKLDNIVLISLFKNQSERFSSANDMKKALEHYLNPDSSSTGNKNAMGQSTLDFLMRRMRHTQDFPALSASISAINKIVSSDAESLNKLSGAILKDFALTNKLLKMVNSASYGQFGGTISTISRGIIILGFDAVRSMAITLMLFEHLQNKAQAASLREEVAAAFMQAIMSRRISAKLGVKNLEEGFVCGMFSSLGKLLAAYYFHEEVVEIRKQVLQGKKSDEQASFDVLGVSYAKLGQAVAQQWRFPDQIVSSMSIFPEADRIRKPVTDFEKIRVATNLANNLSAVAGMGNSSESNVRLSEMLAHYRDAWSLNEKQTKSFLEETLQEFMKEAASFDVSIKRAGFLNRISQFVGVSIPEEKTKIAKPMDSFEEILQLEQALDVSNPKEHETILTAGIQDITNTLVDEYNLNALLRMVLETMYRGIGFQRVMLLLRDPGSRRLIGRFGYGAEIDSLLKLITIPLDNAPDVFQVAMTKNVDVLISDVRANNIRDRVPDWHKTLLKSETFLILPIVMDKKIIGCFYADKAHAGELVIEPKTLSLLKTLRNQAILAIRQKQMNI